jgi:hypothetical protein
MSKKRIQSIISALILYGTELEKRCAQSAEQCLNKEGKLSEQQQRVLERFYREKTRWMKNSVISMKAKQDSINLLQ